MQTKFRGQILNGPRKGEWVYGNLIQTPTRTYILEAEYEVDFIEPEYHEQGMGCGLEDRNITDRYEAMFHGFERALDKCAENHPPFIEVDPKTVGQYIGIKDTNGTEIYSGMYCTSELGNGIVTMSCNGQWCLRDGSIHLAFWKLIDYKWKFEVIESENPDLLTQ